MKHVSMMRLGWEISSTRIQDSARVPTRNQPQAKEECMRQKRNMLARDDEKRV
jgi:hypothetical protein